MSERLVLVSDIHSGLGAAGAHYGPRFVDEFDGDEAFPAFLTWLRSGGRRPSHLVLLGDTLDFLRVPVPQALYARNDAEAVEQLERIAAAHPMVFEALSAIANDGTVIDFVVGNHDVELARPTVQGKLRTLLGAPGHSAALWKICGCRGECVITVAADAFGQITEVPKDNNSTSIHVVVRDTRVDLI